MPVLHFVCGKAGAGKTTLARGLGATLPALVFVEDEWIVALGFEVTSLADFVAASGRCRRVIRSMAQDLLRMNVPVVFDFAGNTRKDWQWVREILDATGADHVLHVIEATDEQCLANIHRRNDEKPPGIYAGYVSDDTFHQVTRHFVPPQQDERFVIEVHAGHRT